MHGNTNVKCEVTCVHIFMYLENSLLMDFFWNKYADFYCYNVLIYVVDK